MPGSLLSYMGVGMTRFARALRRNAALRLLSHGIERWSDLGTHGYGQDDRRRLKILNMIAGLVVIATGTYAIQQTYMDYEQFKPVILINAALFVIAAFLPFCTE